MTAAASPRTSRTKSQQFPPGSLVNARGREWVVLSGSTQAILKLRPISGSEEDQSIIHTALEKPPVQAASFPAPAPSPLGNHETALLLKDALTLSLRRGAGPFRSFGQIAIEPRAYQLVPLLMALKQNPVRLLIADDVGIGKTIEAALIARELLDRGDIQRFTVLCPPHLVEQWVSELQYRFHLRPVAVTANSAARLERQLPPSESLFSAHPHTVVSLDYIKSERRRAEFLRACPELVIVDEAHTCSSSGQGRQQRYALLKGLVESPERHLVLLTATPHSGDEDAYFRLLGLLDPSFLELSQSSGAKHRALRERLAAHFVQRRRPDIDEWQDNSTFPQRERTELTYQLSGAWESFFDAILGYAESVVAQAGDDTLKQRLNFWGTLALMRCVASSPAAAAQALRTRAGLNTEIDEAEVQANIFDGSADQLVEDDLEPSLNLELNKSEQATLNALIEQAEQLKGKQGDPKLALLEKHLKGLFKAGFSPVIFCRYIATAHYLKQHLSAAFPTYTIEAITGELSADERRERIEFLAEDEQRALVATDCLSEGINLQDAFNAVVHYDLSWNPTRHEQREGRVDRFGQKAPVVRASLIYGANNPVDGAVLEVILRKADKIREELGVPVPLPDDNHSLTHALMRAVMLRKAERNKKRQQFFDFGELPEAKALSERWVNLAEIAKKNRTVFAQRRLKPEEVLPEWQKSLEALGGAEDVQRFTSRALARLGGALEPLPGAKISQSAGFKAPLGALPKDVQERLEAAGLSDNFHLDFKYPPAARCNPVQRSHALVAILAETILGRTLAAEGTFNPADPSRLGRVGAWVAPGISERCLVALVRLRFQLSTQRGKQNSNSPPLMVEEATAIAWQGKRAPIEGQAALSLLLPSPLEDLNPTAQAKAIERDLKLLDSKTEEFKAFAERRAEQLLADHRRMREASEASGRYQVKAIIPADIIGVFSLFPKVG